MSDKVNHPAHYNNAGIECIEAIVLMCGKKEAIGFCKGNAIKYLWRQGLKGEAKTDVEKARWYINYAKELCGESELPFTPCDDDVLNTLDKMCRRRESNG